MDPHEWSGEPELCDSCIEDELAAAAPGAPLTRQQITVSALAAACAGRQTLLAVEEVDAWARNHEEGRSARRNGGAQRTCVDTRKPG